jgi:hypothetical protein
MQVDFNRVLTAINGEEIKEAPNSDKPFTLAIACINALMMPAEEGQRLTGEEQVKRYDLATAIYASTGPLEVTTEQVALAKDLVAKVYGPLVVGQVWKMLEGQL